MSSELRIAHERTGAVPTAWRLMPRAHWPNGAVGSPLWRPYSDLTIHRDHTGEQILLVQLVVSG